MRVGRTEHSCTSKSRGKQRSRSSWMRTASGKTTSSDRRSPPLPPTALRSPSAPPGKQRAPARQPIAIAGPFCRLSLSDAPCPSFFRVLLGQLQLDHSRGLPWGKRTSPKSDSPYRIPRWRARGSALTRDPLSARRVHFLDPDGMRLIDSRTPGERPFPRRDDSPPTIRRGLPAQ